MNLWPQNHPRNPNPPRSGRLDPFLGCHVGPKAESDPMPAAEPTPPPPSKPGPPAMLGIYRAPDSDPGNLAYHYDPGGPMPEVCEPETIFLLAKARGPRALDECLDAVREIDRRLATAVEADSAGRLEHEKGNGLADALQGVLPRFYRQRPPYRPVSIDLAARRSIYWSRACSLAAAIGVEMRGPFDPRYPRLAEARAELEKADDGIRALERTAADDGALGRLGIEPEPDVADVDASILKLAQRRFVVLAPKQRYAVPGGFAQVSRDRPVFAQDVFIRQANQVYRRRRELAGLVVALEARDAHKAAADAELVRLTSERVKAAVEAAGGPEAIVDAIVIARALSGPQVADPGASTIAAIDSELAKLSAAKIDPSSKAVTSAQARRADAVAAAEAMRLEQARQRRTAAEDLVAAALAGQANAAQSLKALATSSITSFPDGFAAALAD